MDNITIAVVSGVVGVVATIIALYKDARKETKVDTEHNTSVKEEIKYISRGVEDIKFDTKSIMATMLNMNERLIRTEESVKSAHEKIDNHVRKGDV